MCEDKARQSREVQKGQIFKMFYHSCIPFMKKGRNKLIISSLRPSFVPEAEIYKQYDYTF